MLPYNFFSNFIKSPYDGILNMIIIMICISIPYGLTAVFSDKKKIQLIPLGAVAVFNITLVCAFNYFEQYSKFIEQSFERQEGTKIFMYLTVKMSMSLLLGIIYPVFFCLLLRVMMEWFESKNYEYHRKTKKGLEY